METPNYDKQQGKHPIPHAEGIAKDENAEIKKKKDDASKKKDKKEE
ncbi:hypothetical protein [Christiangramia aquimixticola]